MPATPDLTPKPPLREWWWRPFAFGAGLAAFLGLFYAIGYAPYESPRIQWDREHLEKMATQRALVLGSSHGFDILPEKMGLEGVNLAHGGQDVFEMIFMARAVKRAAPQLDTVIFTISYFTFALDNAAFLDDGVQRRIGRRLVMYTAFPSLDFISGDGSTWIKGLLAPVVTGDHWKSVLWPSRSERRSSPRGSDLPPNPKADKKVASPTGVVSHAKRRCDQYDALIRNMASNHPGLEDDAYHALWDVAHDLEASGVRVVLVIPPFHEAYNECFDEKRQEVARNLAARIAKETGAEFIDAGRERKFSGNREFFGNSDHMNRDGKVEFSRWLGQELRRRGK